MADAPRILEINGPIAVVHLPGARNGEQIRVGNAGLVGEIIELDGPEATAQIYESTEGLRPGEPVAALGHPLSVELGPGLLGSLFDGVQRPLTGMLRASGDRIARGLNLPILDRQKSWHFIPDADLPPGATLRGGERLGMVQETPSISHQILAPPDVAGELLDLAPEGDYTLEQVIAHVRQGADGAMRRLNLYQRWPIRIPRPYQRRDHAVLPLLTGQRILDTFFPLLKGGKAAVPGPFGAGKTMLQQQIVRWCNAQIVIYVGCGERGNELVDVLETLPRLTDPNSGRPLMERTLMVANTSNMPVVAREASIYVGITMAEYFRDQGYDVVMVADSTSRWAEALREVSARLGQMPAEEGYPAYLASRLSAFYERAGRVRTLAGQFGSVSLIGAVSPPGGDFSEPVTNHTKDAIQTFWALSKELADARHYPAVDWSESFSGQIGTAAQWWTENVDARWERGRAEALALLSQAEELARIVNLVGLEALSSTQRWDLEGAALVREGVLQQSAVDEVDSYCSPQKQFLLLNCMLDIIHAGADMLALGVPVQRLLKLPLLARARRYKSQYGNDQLKALQGDAAQALRAALDPLRSEYTAAQNPPAEPQPAP